MLGFCGTPRYNDSYLPFLGSMCIFNAMNNTQEDEAWEEREI